MAFSVNRIRTQIVIFFLTLCFSASVVHANEIDLFESRISKIPVQITKKRFQQLKFLGLAIFTKDEDVKARYLARVHEIDDKIDSLRETLAELRAQARHHEQLQRAGWRLAFRDEFGGQNIKSAKWSHEVNCSGGGNNEQQCYTERPENSYLEKGMLHIVAREESYSGPALFDDDPAYDPNDMSVTRPFTSARLRTKNKFDFKYGRVEVRAKVPGGQGMWPAIWMLPTDNVYGIWPSSGEIDIMEAVNLGIWPNEVHGTLHYGLPWPQWENHGQTLPMETNPADNFHVYAVEWEGDEIRWYLDGVHWQTQRSEGWYNYIWAGQQEGFKVATPRAPYDENFHLIMNLATGGDWPGNPDTGWIEDREMLVDYVRVYQCEHPRGALQNIEDGQGCGSIDESILVNEDQGAPQVNDFLLFADGVESIILDADGDAVSNTVVPGYWELDEGTVLTSEIDLGGEEGVVWDVVFGGLGNVFLTAEDMSENAEYSTGVALTGGSGWTNNGEIEFDMLVNSASEDSQFLVKIDSGYPDIGEVVIETPTPGEWQQVSVRMSDLLANANPAGGGVNIADVLNLFVLEYSGTSAHVQLDNIRLQCAVNSEPESWQLDQNCDIEPIAAPIEPEGDSLDIYIDGFTLWDIFDCCSGVTISEEIEAGNNVLQFAYDTDPGTNTVTFFQSASPIDLTSYAGGTLEFDMYVVAPPANPAAVPWMIKVDCEFPCGTGDVPITDSVEGVLPTQGAWQHFTFNIDDLVSRGLELTHVDAPLVIFPAWGNQDGATFRLDNVQWKKSSGEPSPQNVTFTVDMSGESLSPSDTVFVSGSFGELPWCGGCYPLTEIESGIWATTVSIDPGSYQYKFQINEWAAQEMVPPEPACGITLGGFTNRPLLVENQSVDLPVTPYNGCPDIVSGPTEPLVAAPTPTRPEATVISIFSDAYTNIAGVNFDPFWGQATDATQVDVAGNNTLKYAGLNYQGTDFSGNPQNVTGATHLHLDFWTADSSALNVYLISPGPSETPFALPITQGEWVSVDIPLSAFTAVDLNNVIQFKFDGNGTVFLDNLYFYSD